MKINKAALIFGLSTSFLTGLGFTIISPVVPFMVSPFVNHQSQALIVTLLLAIYALCTFFAAPLLGSLSDRFGRKPILLLSLAGSALGYLVFGLTTSLFMLFLGRIIDGLTAGNIVTLFAYFADITDEKNRTKVFGWVQAAVGLGTISGPTVGGLLAHFGVSFPFYFAAGLSLLNLLLGAYFMKESLSESVRAEAAASPSNLKELNLFPQIFNLLRTKSLASLLFVGLLIWLPNGALQGIISQFSLDSFAWTTVFIGLALSIMGFMDIFTQLLLLPPLLKILNEKSLMRLAIACETLGYLFFVISSLSTFWPIFILAMFVFAFGDSIFGTSFNGQLSKSASASSQGKLQGASQALQALTRIVGPLMGGLLYTSLGHAAPMLMGFTLLLVSLILLREKRTVKLETLA